MDRWGLRRWAAKCRYVSMLAQNLDEILLPSRAYGFTVAPRLGRRRRTAATFSDVRNDATAGVWNLLGEQTVRWGMKCCSNHETTPE